MRGGTKGDNEKGIGGGGSRDDWEEEKPDFVRLGRLLLKRRTLHWVEEGMDC